ncbi:MAG: amidohydrolase family protein, partial [Bacteroidota bacterium]
MLRLSFLIILFLSIVPINAQEHDQKIVTKERYEGPIIDMHIHAYEKSMLFGMTHPPTMRGETYAGVQNPEELKKQVLQKFKEHNIVKAIVTSGDLWYKDRPDVILIGQSRLDSIDAQFENGKLHALAELSPFYTGIRADEPSQSAFFSTAERLGIPVGFHLFPGGPNYGIRLMPRAFGAIRAYNAHPKQLEDILAKHPNLKLYIMHGAWPYIEELKALMYMYPNLYVDIAVVNWILPVEEFNFYIKSLIRAGFENRIMYGSDQMVWPQLITLGIETVNKADFLTMEQKENIFYNNAAKFLDLSHED